MMMFVLMAALLVRAITVSAIQVIGTDVLGSVKEVEADQVYNIAQAGVHYAIGQLQLSGAATYTGGTLPITSGTTTLGTATITVNCIDYPTPTASDVLSSTNPCTAGSYPGYRRIISTGSLPVSGPSRTIVAVVKGTSSGGGNWSTAVCSLSSVVETSNDSSDTTTIYGDVVSNGSINLTPPAGLVKVLGGSGYTGKLSAVGTVSCSGGCSAAGGLFPGQAGPLCSAPTPPTFTPGSSSLTVASGTTTVIDCSSGTCPSYKDVTVSVGTCSGAITFTTLQINTSASGTTDALQLNTLTIAPCGRLVISGAGNVNLRIGATTGESLDVGGAGPWGSHATTSTPTHFGVGLADTLTTPAPVPASQLIVWVNSNGTGPYPVNGSADCDTTTSCAAWISHASGAATVIVPNGIAQIDDSAEPNPFYGAVLGTQVNFSGNGTFTSDTSGLSRLFDYVLELQPTDVLEGPVGFRPASRHPGEPGAPFLQGGGGGDRRSRVQHRSRDALWGSRVYPNPLSCSSAYAAAARSSQDRALLRPIPG